jgi:hypothetical protein
MSTFITRTDYDISMTSRILTQIIGETDTIIDETEETAKSIITDRLAGKYDLAAEFAKTDTSRNRSLVRWMLAISVYLFYHRVPDEQVPERVVKDYDDTMKELEMIQQGKLGCSLSRLEDEDGEVISRIRMGSSAQRTHNPFDYTV